MFIKAVQKNGNQVFGHTVYAQQLLALIAAVLIAVLWLILTRVFPKETGKKEP